MVNMSTIYLGLYPWYDGMLSVKIILLIQHPLIAAASCIRATASHDECVFDAVASEYILLASAVGNLPDRFFQLVLVHLPIK